MIRQILRLRWRIHEFIGGGLDHHIANPLAQFLQTGLRRLHCLVVCCCNDGVDIDPSVQTIVIHVLRGPVQVAIIEVVAVVGILLTLLILILRGFP